MKSAERFIAEFPHLLDQQMISLVVATGTTMLLTQDPYAEFIAQSLAEVIECIINKLDGGQTTIKDEPKLEKDHEGRKQTKGSNIIGFYKKRIPCSCLEKKRNKPKEVILGYCSFVECAEGKPMKHLAMCGGCLDACYCCHDCQQNDWPNHSQFCKFVETSQKSKRAVSGEASTTESTADSETEPHEPESQRSKELRTSSGPVQKKYHLVSI